MNNEIERYAAPIERVPNPMALSAVGDPQTAYPQHPQQQQQPLIFDELESFVAAPSTFEDAMMLDSSDLMDVDNTNEILESQPSTSVQEPNDGSTVEGSTKSLNEALRQVIKPISEIPENEEIIESTKRAMEAFQKRNPFPLSKKDKKKQQIEQEELLRDLISPDPIPIQTLSRRTL
uniref:Uncharacterized protein n=1 Tax=Panagrolaimus sp. ES5 TaxID=591445 RepID=A0AC34GK66_9BILA